VRAARVAPTAYRPPEAMSEGDVGTNDQKQLRRAVSCA
jgi:hypothetical protein